MKKKLLQNFFTTGKKDIINDPEVAYVNQKKIDGYFFNIYEQILENSQDISYCISLPNFQVEFISPSIKSLTGKSREEIIGSSTTAILELIHPKDRDIVNHHFDLLIENPKKKPQNISFRIKPPKGIYRWVLNKNTIIFDPQSNTEKLIGSLHDITDQKLTEDALKRSRDRLFMAIEATNDGMWDWRLDSNDVFFDQRFYTMLGYEPYEFQGSFQEWMKRIHPDDLKSVQKQLEKHLEGKSEQWLIEYRFKAKNDRWIWILNRGKVFDRDENDKPLRLVGTHSDITHRKKTELSLKQKHDELLLADEKLKDVNIELLRLNSEFKNRNTKLEEIYQKLQTSEERFRQLAENTQDIFWLRDREKILYVNPAFDKIWGRSRDLIINNPAIIINWIHPDDIKNFKTWIDIDSMNNQPLYIEQYRIIKPDGDIRWIWARMFPVLDTEGKVYRIAGIATDITDLKKFEEELTLAKERALESDRLKSAFLANISHEIRTPMNGIIGFASLLKERVLSQEKREQFVDIITQSSQALLHIIEDLVDISKIEANQLKITPRNFDLNTMMENIYYHYSVEKQLYGKDHIVLEKELEISNTPVFVFTDDARLQQIISNLIANALKFTEKGFVKFGYKLKNLNNLEFFVSDSGIGISDDVKPFIFEQFRQHEITPSRKFGGTGLGLSICKGLIHLFNGNIWFESTKGVGTTFFFNIPLTIMSLISENETIEQPLPTINWSDKTILLVEDDPVNLEYYREILNATNANTVIAITGEDAIEHLKLNNQIDLILLDIRLPNMNGYETFQKIKELKINTPVIAQTAFAQAEDAIKCIEAGFSDYITKPVSRNVLLNKIDYFFQKK